MIIIDKPYASNEIKQYLEETNVPVLKNDFSIEAGKSFKLNLKDDKEFKKLLKSNQRLLTISENSLKWIYDNLEDLSKINGISIMKNKTKVRELLKPLYPDFFFMETETKRLKELDFKTLKTPFVLKPSVGFFSVGVYTVFDKTGWELALADIEANIGEWKKNYSEDVIGKTTFIIEEYIRGEEYALDAYYDENGSAVIVNILKHDFMSDSDVSDRLYYSSKEIIEKNITPFTDFLNSVNAFFNVRNFPLHVELRVKDGQIVPIEFNPMRFAGWCTTDLSYFAYGLRTYDYFFNNKKPDWRALLKEKDNKIYALILLNKPSSYDPALKFDYEALKSGFKKVLNLRKTESADSPVFGFMFTETDAGGKNELEYIVKTDLSEFFI